jgi:hypothetical protein
MTKFVNLTPHKIVLYCKDGSTIEIEPSGKVFRLEERDRVIANVEGIDIVAREFVIPTEVKSYFDDPRAVYIVSLPALMALATLEKAHPELMDISWIVAPDTGSGAVRDEQGRIIGTRRFIIIP